MKTLHSFLLTLIVPILSFGQNPAIQQLEKLTNQTIEQEEVVGIAVGTRLTNGTTWNYSQGYANKETKEAFTTQTISRTASITKPITATAIMQLVEKGLVDLDAPVANYINQFATKKFKNITVRQILQHTSGLSGYKNSKEARNKKQYESLEAAFSIIEDRDLLFEAGTSFSYTSYGYGVLGIIVERTSGLSYENYLKQFIFEPAGMVHSSVEKFGEEIPNKSSIYHQIKPGKIKTITTHNLSDRIAGGGVQSTLEDLLRFGEAILNNTLISKESLQEMIKDHGLKKEGNGYGMGWYLYGENKQAGNVFGHNGEQFGCSAFLFLFPDDGYVTAVLSNTSGYNGHGNLAISTAKVARELKK